MFAGLEIEGIRIAVRILQGFAVPGIVIRKGVQTHLVEGDLTVDHDLPIRGHAGVRVLKRFDMQGVKTVLGHRDAPGHGCVSQAPSVAAHDVQDALGAGPGLGQRVCVGFSTDDVLTAPCAVLALPLDDRVRGSCRIALTLPCGELLFIREIGLWGCEGDAAEHEGLVHVGQSDLVFALGEIKSERIDVNGLLVDGAHGLPRGQFIHVGPDLIPDGVDAHLAIGLHLFFKSAVEAQVVCFLIGSETVDGDFSLGLGFVAALAQVGDFQFVKSGAVDPDMPQGRTLTIAGYEDLCAGLRGQAVGIEAGVDGIKARELDIAAERCVLRKQFNARPLGRCSVNLGRLCPFLLHIAVFHGGFICECVKICPGVLNRLGQGARRDRAKDGQTEQDDTGDTTHRRHSLRRPYEM